MRQINDLKELRKIQMDILSYVDKFCCENKIIYSLAGGSMLGAVRHKGYIPWDDDIDIFMPRNDYDNFVELFSKSHHPYYRVITAHNTKGYYQPYANVSDDRTIIHEVGIEREVHEGVNIDIFPIDFVPENPNSQKSIIKKELFLRDLFTIKGLKWESKRSIMKNLFMAVSKFVLLPVRRKWLSRRIELLAKNACKEYSSKSACLVWGIGIKIMKTSIYENYQDWNFEDRIYKGVVDYDAYLSSLYHNYMELPPIEKQISHHVFEAYWK